MRLTGGTADEGYACVLFAQGQQSWQAEYLDMPIAQINPQGTAIYYQDSGAPEGLLDYTTIVLVHGFAINGGTSSILLLVPRRSLPPRTAIFERMLPYATKYRLRIIAMNSRDYSGSTPYTADELSDYTSHNVDVQAFAVRRWGHEIGGFLAHVCRDLRIPRTTEAADGKTGGLVLVTWSLSVIAGLAILGDPRTLGDELSSQLAPYLRRVIMYGTFALSRSFILPF